MVSPESLQFAILSWAFMSQQPIWHYEIVGGLKNGHARNILKESIFRRSSYAKNRALENSEELRHLQRRNVTWHWRGRPAALQKCRCHNQVMLQLFLSHIRSINCWYRVWMAHCSIKASYLKPYCPTVFLVILDTCVKCNLPCTSTYMDASSSPHCNILGQSPRKWKSWLHLAHDSPFQPMIRVKFAFGPFEPFFQGRMLDYQLGYSPFFMSHFQSAMGGNQPRFNITRLGLLSCSNTSALFLRNFRAKIRAMSINAHTVQYVQKFT